MQLATCLLKNNPKPSPFIGDDVGFETFLCEDCSPTHHVLFRLQATTITIPRSCVSSFHVDHYNFCVLRSIVLELENLMCILSYCIFVNQFGPSQGLN